MKLYPKVITGVLSPQNKGACDWGVQGQVAYGCNSCVVVVDPGTVQVVQVLDKHKATVVKVKWARENYNHDIGSPYTLRLASGDAAGCIIIWDVVLGEVKTECLDGNRPIQALEWLPWQEASRDLLVALHPPCSVILWNADTGTKLWKKTYTETITSLALDPFCFRNMAFLGQDCIVFIDDFTITKTPVSNGKKFYISSPSGGSKVDTAAGGSLEKKSHSSPASRNLAKKMTKMLVGEGKQRDDDSISLQECIQMTYLRSCRHHLVLLYPREILLMDLEINQTVGIISADRSGSPFLEVLPMRQRDVLYCLHENGSISCRLRQRTKSLGVLSTEMLRAFDDSPTGASLEILYELKCQSDSIRMTRHCKVAGVMSCPVRETRLALILSDSRLIFWDLHRVDVQPLEANSLKCSPESSTYQPYEEQNVLPCPKRVLCDMISRSNTFTADGEPMLKDHGYSLRLVMTGLLNGLISPITVIRMCPPLTTKNFSLYEPLLAVGSQIGSVQIVNVSSGQIEKEYSLHTGPVRGLEWASLKSFISYSYPKPTITGLVKNDILHVDCVSGKAHPVRTNRDQESPLEMLRISHLKQYFILVFKDKPVELWDLKTLTILREFSKYLPHPTALEWSPSHNLKVLKKKMQKEQEDEQALGSTTGNGNVNTSETEDTNSVDSMSASSTNVSPSSDALIASKNSVKEHFVFTDASATLYHFVVEGNGFKDATTIPSEAGMFSASWVAWKSDYLVFGDSEGQLCVWDIKAKTSRTCSTHRGWIKKIRFAPGRGNFKLLILYMDGIDAWELNEGKPELLSSLKCPKDMAKVVDADWSGSDRPTVVTVDGCIHMLDLNLKVLPCSVEERELQEEVFSPYMMAPKAAFIMKHLLQHQHWRTQYQLHIDHLRDEDVQIQESVNKNLKLIDNDLAEYLVHCRYGTAERCLLTARLFGDELEINFWTIALHYMRNGKALAGTLPQCSSCVFTKEDTCNILISSSPDGTSEIVDCSAQGNLGEVAALQGDKEPPLEYCYDFLCDNETYKRYQLDRVVLHDIKRVTYEHTRKCVERYMMLGQCVRAVQLLLETEPDNQNYYTDCLRSCLIASMHSSGDSQSTIKLVATNLIANGKLLEGVQLLCLIDKVLDACRYLQTYNSWELAIWLCKSTLGTAECCEVLKRWVEHLSSTQVNQKATAVLVLLSQGHFQRVIEMLYGMRQFNKAACFIEAAAEFGLMTQNSDNRSLIEAVYLEYARQLSNIGLKTAAEFYCLKAGAKGQQLLKEVEILFS